MGESMKTMKRNRNTKELSTTSSGVERGRDDKNLNPSILKEYSTKRKLTLLLHQQSTLFFLASTFTSHKILNSLINFEEASIFVKSISHQPV
jgi:hypothetical protein